MEQQSLWFLEKIDLQEVFCPLKTGNMLDKHIHKSYQRGEYIYLPEEYADRLYFITEGIVKIGTYSEDGKEITKVILQTGEVFGELSLVGQNKRRDFAVAMEKATLCAISILEMKNLMRDRHPLSVFMMNLIGSRLLKMEQRLEALVFKDSRTRIVEFLRELAQERGKRVGFEVLVKSFLTHQEIANLTATSRQTVTTTLNELKKENIITFNRKRLLIRDLSKLA